MTTTTVTNFRKNIYDFVGNAIRYNDPVQITTRNGNAVVLSEEEYNGMLATLELMRIPGMTEHIRAAANDPDDQYVPAEEVGW